MAEVAGKKINIKWVDGPLTWVFYFYLFPFPRVTDQKSDRIQLRPPGSWSLIAYLAVREMRYRGSEVGRMLGLSEPGIMKCVDRGKRMLKDDSELRGKLIS